MPTVRRSRTLAAAPDDIWAIVGSAHHLPRWWPRVTRVENVDDDAFTQVLTSPKGRPVRADFRVVESAPPLVRRWTQELAGSPFARILAASETAIRLEPDGAGSATRVTVVLAQRLHGMALLGGLMVRRASARTLDDALDGLEALIGPLVP